jgi:hypothetical protein
MRSINQFAKVEGHESLMRDMSSHAILSTNENEYQAYRRSRDAIKRQSQEIQELKSDMQDIKEMLQALLKGKE